MAQPVPDSTSDANTAMAAIRAHRGIFMAFPLWNE